jgi:hypothetical protein
MDPRLTESFLEGHPYYAGRPVDTYFDRIIKCVPSDVICVWFFLSAVINSAAPGDLQPALQWVLFGLMLAATAVWTRAQTSVPGQPPAVAQTLISTGLFAAWVFGLGGPFATLGFYQPLNGSLIMLLYTLIAPAMVPRDRYVPEGTSPRRSR